MTARSLDENYRTYQAGLEQFSPAFHLLQRFFAEEGFTTSPDRIQSALQFILSDPDSAVFLAASAEAAVGVASVSTGLSLEYGRYAEIDDLYVIPAQRGKGIGKQLVDGALDWCRSRGCALVLVTVTLEGEAALGLTRFYDRLGFVDTRRKIMTLRLIH